jgi:CDP-6-deoxy-D-xylo-4-hexulose-3-dehydrase
MALRGHWKEWKEGDPVLINRIVWDQAEVGQLQDVLDNDWFGPGQKVQKFARVLSDYIGINHVQPVNSGSSALTLAVEAMIELGYWKPGDWILHPLLTFPTSIVPAIRAGLTPIFVDVDPHTYQIDLKQAEKATKIYGDKIKGAIIPHLLGNICDMQVLLDILDGRPFVEDCCDTMGGYYDGLHVGNFGTVAAFSFYGSHHITTAGVGGALVTHNEEIYRVAKSMTHWGRTDYDDLDSLNDPYGKFEKRYWYETLGADYQMTELQAAFGIVQMARLDKANSVRIDRFSQLNRFFNWTGFENFFYMPYTDSDEAAPSWFAYPLTIKPLAPFDRREFATHLIENKIEIRPLFTGNILKHPAFARLPGDRKILADGSSVADLIGDNGLFIPAWGMSDGEMEYMIKVLEKFFERYK